LSPFAFLSVVSYDKKQHHSTGFLAIYDRMPFVYGILIGEVSVSVAEQLREVLWSHGGYLVKLKRCKDKIAMPSDR
jgi:hypothetical protein